tara:strand:- start:8470 stop:8640 length:171 start_codon:yes stop_codon:yes gene_type:complete
MKLLNVRKYRNLTKLKGSAGVENGVWGALEYDREMGEHGNMPHFYPHSPILNHHEA